MPALSYSTTLSAGFKAVRRAGFKAVLSAGFRAVLSAGFIARAVTAFVDEGDVVLSDLVVGLAAGVLVVSDFF